MMFQYRMTSIHYCAKEGNADILHEILNQIDPTMLQGACNRIALVSSSAIFLRVSTLHNTTIILF